MAKKALEFDFKKAFQMIEILESDKEKAVTEAIEASSKIIQKDLASFAESKKVTGKFRKALKENPQVEKKGGRIEMRLGFDINKPHGIVAIFFNKGTPSMPKTGFIDKAFKNKKAKEAMNHVLSEYWKKVQNKAKSSVGGDS